MASSSLPPTDPDPQVWHVFDVDGEGHLVITALALGLTHLLKTIENPPGTRCYSFVTPAIGQEFEKQTKTLKENIGLGIVDLAYKYGDYPVVHIIWYSYTDTAWASFPPANKEGEVYAFGIHEFTDTKKTKYKRMGVLSYGDCFGFYGGGPHVDQHHVMLSIILYQAKLQKISPFARDFWKAYTRSKMPKGIRFSKKDPKERTIQNKMIVLFHLSPEIFPEITCPDCGDCKARGFVLDPETLAIVKAPTCCPKGDYAADLKALEENLDHQLATVVRTKKGPCCVAFWRRLRTHILHKQGSMGYAALLVGGEVEALANLPWAVIREWAVHHADTEKLASVNWAPARGNPTKFPGDDKREWAGLVDSPKGVHHWASFSEHDLLAFMLENADRILYDPDSLISDEGLLRAVAQAFPITTANGHIATRLRESKSVYSVLVSALPSGPDPAPLPSKEVFYEYLVTVYPLIRAIFRMCGYRVINPCQLPDEAIAGHRLELYPVFGHEPSFAIEPITREMDSTWSLHLLTKLQGAPESPLLQVLIIMLLFFEQYEQTDAERAVVQILRDLRNAYAAVRQNLPTNGSLIEYLLTNPASTLDGKRSREELLVDRQSIMCGAFVTDVPLESKPTALPGVIDDGFDALEYARVSFLRQKSTNVPKFDISANVVTAIATNSPNYVQFYRFAPRSVYLEAVKRLNRKLLAAPGGKAALVAEATELARDLCKSGHTDLFCRIVRQFSTTEFPKIRPAAKPHPYNKTMEVLLRGIQEQCKKRKLNHLSTNDFMAYSHLWLLCGKIDSWVATSGIRDILPHLREANRCLKELCEVQWIELILEPEWSERAGSLLFPSYWTPVMMDPATVEEAKNSPECVALLLDNCYCLLNALTLARKMNLFYKENGTMTFVITDSVTAVPWLARMLRMQQLFKLPGFYGVESKETSQWADEMKYVSDNEQAASRHAKFVEGQKQTLVYKITSSTDADRDWSGKFDIYFRYYCWVHGVRVRDHTQPPVEVNAVPDVSIQVEKETHISTTTLKATTTTKAPPLEWSDSASSSLVPGQTSAEMLAMSVVDSLERRLYVTEKPESTKTKSTASNPKSRRK